MEIVKNRFSNLTKEQLGQDQQGKDIANEHQWKALKEGCVKKVGLDKCFLKREE